MEMEERKGEERENLCLCPHGREYHGRDGCVYPYATYAGGIEDGCDCLSRGCADGHDMTHGMCALCGLSWEDLEVD